MCENHIVPQLHLHSSHSGEYKTQLWFGLLFLLQILRAVLFVCFLFIFFFHEAVVCVDGFPSPLFIGHHSTKSIYEERQAAPK